LYQLIAQYPHVPQFKNLLAVIFSKQGNSTKSYEINRLIVKEHPDYLFGKLNLANEYLDKKELEKIPELLGQSLSIHELYPHRRIFHKDEVVAFNITVIHYFIQSGNIGEAETRLESLKKLDPENEEIDSIEMKLMILRMQAGLERYQQQQKTVRSVKAIAKKVAEPTNVKPVFHHSLIEELTKTACE